MPASTESNMRVVVVGAGPIGLRVASEIAARKGLELAAVVDVDPQKLGRDVPGTPLVVTGEAPDDVEVAVVTTTSSLEKITPHLEELAGKRLHVVSTCEELAWPWSRPDLARRIDDAARRAGVAVVGTGVNPGFLMDALPLFLTAPCRAVTSVRVERVQDASTRRRPFQDKVGVGQRPEDVLARLQAQETGHVGLAESAAMIAARLGFDRGAGPRQPGGIFSFSERADVVVATESVTLQGRTVNAGEVLGVVQEGKAVVGSPGKTVIELYFRAVFGEKDAHDRIVIDGDPALDVTLKGGVHGDVATAAIVVNALFSITKAQPGLRTMADMPLVSFTA